MSGPMNLVYPTPGASADVWGTVLDTMLGLIENHDHTSGRGSLVPSAGIGINADLAFAGFALTGAKAFGFTEVATSAMTSYADALFVDSSSHNLYFRNSAGTNVRLVNGNSIDVSSVGAWGLDYAASGCLAGYDSATSRFLFEQPQSPTLRAWGGLGCGPVDLYQPAISIANRVRLQSPTALAVSYAVTFPAAVPAQAAPLTIDATGALKTDGVFGTNQNLQLQGTGYIKRSTRTLTIPLMPTNVSVTGGSVSTVGSGVGAQVNASTTAYFPIQVPSDVNDAITITSVKLYHSIAGTGTVTYELDVSGQLSIAGFGPVTGATATGFSSPITLTPTTPLAGVSTQVLWLKVVTPGTASGPVVQVVITTTIP